ncbi:WD40-repeat-containing domain protein [Radiomyces spectabilis]|uniref:WD40-repeat-containing domain protein n=1 Tax=Radiomyces spectabilis TaxID=64574 RepID=UPI0022205276|nr:WD40-repeat-containing domain protein [Radiomyces spectabilis]KAI8366692.1 WD40-repeat-containing domain protein [Radiomyces spectabilis]
MAESKKPKSDGLDEAHVENEEKYLRGKSVSYKKIKDKKLKGKLRKQEDEIREAARAAARAELLLGEEAGFLEAEGIERTYKFQQDQLKDAVDVNTANKIFTLDLPEFGPYAVDYTRNGRHLLIGGKKGHIAAFDWQTSKLHFETHVKEIVRDVKWLHNETMLAVAQKKYVYIYDHTGLEIHRLKDHIEVNKLEFLPYHYLLATVGNAGYLKYQDTSTGQLVSEHRTKLGPCKAMAQNPYNAVLHLGHSNGTVTLWSPTMSAPLVKMLCHKGPVQSVAVDNSGRYMATSGLDGQLKIWDIRKFEELQSYYTPRPATSLSISQKGLLGVGWSTHVSIWKDAFLTKQESPYMNHLQPSSAIFDVQFCPYEDVLGFGHEKGISSIVVPGAGEPNFDSLEANPFQTKKQRQEAEVHSLLDKLQPEMIVLDPTQIGKVTKVTKEELKKRRLEEMEEKGPDTPAKEKKKMRGRNSALKRHLRKKNKNVMDQRKMELLEKIGAEKEKRAAEQKPKTFTTLDIF